MMQSLGNLGVIYGSRDRVLERTCTAEKGHRRACGLLIWCSASKLEIGDFGSTVWYCVLPVEHRKLCDECNPIPCDPMFRYGHCLFLRNLPLFLCFTLGPHIWPFQRAVSLYDAPSLSN